jgi:trans-aconitate methyltransferase
VEVAASTAVAAAATASAAAFFACFASPYHFPSPEDYETWLLRANFRLRRAELIPKVMLHAGREAFFGWLRTTWFPYTDRLPAERAGAFLGDVVDAYTAVHPPDSNGVINLRMVRLEVEAEVA